ncbi:MAG: hypothetical protein O3C27_14375, partial [Actinomycetota bacterium]|nr:hypothetical protein [Actinomycetota bacterium]
YEPPPYTPPPHEPPPLEPVAFERPAAPPSSPGGPDWAVPVKGAKVPDPFGTPPPPPIDEADPTRAWPTFESPPPPPPAV